ncbi:MAG: THUMP domain-containing protein [Saprospiraceae bacterium]|nr:THUMP domain-containing protein [Saprospiraceae bacterium]MDW8483753.1 THUMP domain-containing protein [Saprospiraceae bacterium]
MKSNTPIIVKTFHGLETVLAEELKALGASNTRLLKRAVSCTGDLALIYRANYELRTALRVLIPIHTFEVSNERAYYRAVREVEWNQYLDVSGTLAVDAVLSGGIFRHSQYMALLTKDAIVDYYRDRYARRPNINPEAPHLRVHARIHGSKCTLLLDASGDSLHKRGYRRDTVEAPLNEVLAAGLVLLSGWNDTGPFVDPMCGSGTIAIEAALLAANIPPQRTRSSFGFFRWKNFDRKLWERVKAEADARVKQPIFPIYASDKEGRARNATAINLLSAGLEGLVQVQKIPFEKLSPPEAAGVLITNPPYDERLRLEDVACFYKVIGNRLKKAWSGWTAWIISSNREALNYIGLQPSQKMILYNGALECVFQKFELHKNDQRD